MNSPGEPLAQPTSVDAVLPSTPSHGKDASRNSASKAPEGELAARKGHLHFASFSTRHSALCASLADMNMNMNSPHLRY